QACWLWQTIPSSTGKHIFDAALQADPVALRDEHWLDLRPCTQSGSNGFMVVDQGLPVSNLLAHQFVFAHQDRLRAADGGQLCPYSQVRADAKSSRVRDA